MDRYKALELEKELVGQSIDGFVVNKFINNGKSAAVFEAIKGHNSYALKVFDNELIERFGHEIQTKRIEQEISLKGHSISNLVQIFEGGNVKAGDQQYYFIVMEYIDGKNLYEYIQTETYDEGFVIKVLANLHKTTEQLLVEKGIAHRDIKPENIMITAQGDAIIMDLGVLKFVGAKSFSDEEEKSFVGTLRYAAPEFLLRTELDSTEGWRALNYYQIGATMHDLIMKKELFQEVTPYTNLVIAIKDDMPSVSNTNYSFELLQLTRDLLSKDWKTRLELVTQRRIDTVLENKKNGTTIKTNLDGLLKVKFRNQAKFDEIEKLYRTRQELRQRRDEIGQRLFVEFDKCLMLMQTEGVCKSIMKSNGFLFDTDRNQNDILVQNYLYQFTGDLNMGFPKNFYVLSRISNDDKQNSEIDIWGIWPTGFTKASISNPIELFKNLAKEKQHHNRNNAVKTINTITIYKGIVDFDESFSEYLSNQVINFFTKSLKAVENIVDEEVKWQEHIAKSNQRVMTRISHGNKNVIIDRL